MDTKVELNVNGDIGTVTTEGQLNFVTNFKIPVGFSFAEYGRLSPAWDITAYESTLLMMLLMSCVSNHYYSVDYQTFIKEHELERHFKK